MEHLDAAESLYLARQLELVLSKTYDIRYPELRFRQFIPVDNSMPSGTKSYSYKVYDQVGVAKLIAAYADDLPRADVFASEQMGRIRVLGASYGYSYLEVKAGARTGQNLEQRKANAARTGHRGEAVQHRPQRRCQLQSPRPAQPVERHHVYRPEWRWRLRPPS